MDEYIQWMSDIKERKEKEEEKNSMIQQLEQFKKRMVLMQWSKR